MDMIKQLFPYSFGTKTSKELLLRVVVYLVTMLIVSAVCWVIGLIPFIGGIIAWLIGGIVGLYVLGGIVFVILDYLKVLK